MKKTISILLAFILLISSLGININRHYCGNHLVKSAISLIPANLSCGMNNDNTCEFPFDNISKKCCDNQHDLIQMKEIFLGCQKTAVSQTTYVFLIAFVQNFLFHNTTSSLTNNKTDRSSLFNLQKDITVLTQVFRL